MRTSIWNLLRKIKKLKHLRHSLPLKLKSRIRVIIWWSPHFLETLSWLQEWAQFLNVRDLIIRRTLSLTARKPLKARSVLRQKFRESFFTRPITQTILTRSALQWPPKQVGKNQKVSLLWPVLFAQIVKMQPVTAERIGPAKIHFKAFWVEKTSNSYNRLEERHLVLFLFRDSKQSNQRSRSPRFRP